MIEARRHVSDKGLSLCRKEKKMKAKFSDYLSGIKPGLQKMISILRQDYDYVSVLATDSNGLALRISQRSRSVSGETMTTERGIVVRVCKSGQYAEYAFNRFDQAHPCYGGAICSTQSLTI